MIERLWCTVCQHGVDGERGKVCPICVVRGREGNCGTLQTPDEAVEEKKKFAEAVKLQRKANEVRGQKTVSEQIADMESNILAKIKKEFDLVPKSKVEVKTVPAEVVEEVKEEQKQTVAEYRESKKSTKSKK